jgi:hypothetical protein
VLEVKVYHRWSEVKKMTMSTVLLVDFCREEAQSRGTEGSGNGGCV